MRQHVTPVTPGAQIPMPGGGTLSPGGLDVEMSAYWWVMAKRGDVIVTAPLDPSGGTSPPPTPTLQLTDVLPFLRGGVGGSVTVADLVAFLVPFLGSGGGTAPPAADSQSGALLALGLL